jgi:pilus assembly protein CpaC
MSRLRIPGLAAIGLALTLGVVWAAPVAPRGDSPTPVRSYDAVSRQQITVGKSIRIESREDITRVSVGAKEVADFVLLSPKEVYVTGLAPGLTNLMLWGSGNRVLRVIDLDVAPDVSRLKKMIYDLLPDEAPTIKVMANQNTIVLSGTVKDTGSIQKILSLAEGYVGGKVQSQAQGQGQAQGGGQAGSGKVINLLSVGGVQQIMLEVRVAEMTKSVLNRMGINFNAIGDGNFAYTLLGGLSSVYSGMFNIETPSNVYQYLSSTSGGAPTQVTYHEFNPSTTKSTATLNQATAVARFNTNWGGMGNTTWTGFIDMLKENGLVRILAEPNLVCINGQTADFLAGGQIPVPVPAGLGTTTIEWKDFGVGLKFTPTIVSGDRINLKVHPEVSNLDYTRSITIDSNIIPSINTRRTSTTVELKNGQSFAVAGMLSESSRNVADKYPWIGDIPILGNLFKSSEFQKDQTELVIIITAHLVKPLDKKAMALPTDTSHEPDDLEYFLNMTWDGKSQDKVAAPKPVTGAALDGDFGHAVPMAAVTRQPGYTE